MLRKFFIMCLIVFSINAYAERKCDSDEWSLMDKFSQKVGRKVAKSRQGKNNIRVKLLNCTIKDSKVLANIETTWNGSFISSNFYNEDGLITIYLDKEEYDYKTTYQNGILKDWIFAFGAAEVLYFISNLE